MTKKLSPEEKNRRKPAHRACTLCSSKHLQCSNTRPCRNCIKRNVPHECKDSSRKRAKYMAPVESPYASSAGVKPAMDFMGQASGTDDAKHLTLAPKAMAEPDLGAISEFKQNRDSPGSTLSNNTNFHSNFLNQEYMMLGDLISKPASPSLEFSPAPPQAVVSPSFMNEANVDLSDTRPFISLREPNSDNDALKASGFNFDLSPAESKQYVSPLVSHHIYQTVQDIYSNTIMNFDYPTLYHSLTFFLKRRFSTNDKLLSSEEKKKKTNNLLIILKLIASYRPTFISAHKSLFQPFDFQFLEMSFQRCLIDYENLSKLNASPTIIWRRTGEIVSISNDLGNLLGFSIPEILSKRTFIIELMHDDESIVNYFHLFKSVAVGNLHSSIVTRCKLIRRRDTGPLSLTNANLGSQDYIEFCSVWTVKRDLFDLPMMIVGQFLPILASA